MRRLPPPLCCLLLPAPAAAGAAERPAPTVDPWAACRTAIAAANIRYAAAFLRRLYARHGGWEAAIAAYHSADPARGGAYHRKIALARLGSAWTVGGLVPLHASPALNGLGAPGFRPALRFQPPQRRPRLTCARA